MSKPNVHDLSAWFLDKESMSQKKVQKLSYYAVAWGYALLDNPIVSNPEFQAWVHGPVSRPLWNSYGSYGWDTINKNTKRWKTHVEGKITGNKFSGSIIELLEAVWITYGDKSGLELEALSHKEMPWRKARGKLSEFERSSNPISPDDMRKYYKSIYIAS